MILTVRKTYNPFLMDVNRILENFFDNSWEYSWSHHPLPKDFRNLFSLGSSQQFIRTEKKEDGTLKYEFDVPGVDKNNIEVHYDGETQILTVSSTEEKETKTDEDNKNVAQKHFSRTYNYQVSTQDLDPDTIEATHTNGVLVVSGRPQEKHPNKKSIEIK